MIGGESGIVIAILRVWYGEGVEGKRCAFAERGVSGAWEERVAGIANMTISRMNVADVGRTRYL